MVHPTWLTTLTYGPHPGWGTPTPPPQRRQTLKQMNSCTCHNNMGTEGGDGKNGTGGAGPWLDRTPIYVRGCARISSWGSAWMHVAVAPLPPFSSVFAAAVTATAPLPTCMKGQRHAHRSTHPGLQLRHTPPRGQCRLNMTNPRPSSLSDTIPTGRDSASLSDEKPSNHATVP